MHSLLPISVSALCLAVSATATSQRGVYHIPLQRQPLTRERWDRMVDSRALYSRAETRRRLSVAYGDASVESLPIIPQLNLGT